MHTNINIKNLIITTIIEVINFDVSEAVVCMLWERASEHVRTRARLLILPTLTEKHVTRPWSVAGWLCQLDRKENWFA